ncbi:hypothetical protein AB0D04_37675 [Streptomyces sp. NPDC048483]|uniref:hypothetical protein n=1 Tax=Streptomyces sp. NPDC048483 TaxID=3154927 RepID=UPI003439A21B
MSLTGLPGMDQAEAKPKPSLKKGKRCDEEYKDFSDVAVGGPPGRGALARVPWGAATALSSMGG